MVPVAVVNSLASPLFILVAGLTATRWTEASEFVKEISK
jgi:hypothetical protein